MDTVITGIIYDDLSWQGFATVDIHVFNASVFPSFYPSRLLQQHDYSIYYVRHESRSCMLCDGPCINSIATRVMLYVVQLES